MSTNDLSSMLNPPRSQRREKPSPRTRRGRPARFDRKLLCERALGVFCQKGYSAASTQALCEAMELTPPSLYNSFGNKEQLFLEILDRYHQSYLDRLDALATAHTDPQAFVANLVAMQRSMHTQKGALGCLIVNSSINTAEPEPAIGEALKRIHNTNEKRLHGVFKRFQKAGKVANSFDALRYARFLNGNFQGAAVLARGQGSKAAVSDLLETAEQCVTAALTG